MKNNVLVSANQMLQYSSIMSNDEEEEEMFVIEQTNQALHVKFKASWRNQSSGTDKTCQSGRL